MSAGGTRRAGRRPPRPAWWWTRARRLTGGIGTSATGGRVWSQLGGCGMMTQAVKLSATGPVEVLEVVSSRRSSNGRGTGDGDLRGADRRSLARGGLLPRSCKVHRTGKRHRPRHLRTVQRGALPRVLQGVRGPARLGRLLAYDPGHQQPAVLEVVRGRPAERLLQLRRPAPGDQPQQGGAD